MIEISPNFFLNEAEIKISFIRSPGPGGQNVNKVATAVQLRFNVLLSPSLSEPIRVRLISLAGKQMTSRGELIIKASRFRTQERNKKDAIARLRILLQRAAITPKKRRKTKPSWAVIERRLENKKLHAKTKSIRRTKINKED